MDGTLAPPAPLPPDPWSIPLDAIDPSRAELYVSGLQHAYFQRLRREDPVHYCAHSAFGPYWSITTFNDIMAVDANHAVFSSKPTIVIGDMPDGEDPPMFIAMDPPVHDVQRKAVTPAVAPARVADLEAVIRRNACEILDGLPRNETFNWVERVSRELTTRMLAVLFDVTFE
jgi:cytochrome P450